MLCPLQADSRPLLQVFPDYSADPVWDETGMADLDRLQVAGPTSQ